MKKLIASLVVMTAVFALADSVTGVTAKQRWPWNGIVDVDFTLTGNAMERYRIVLEAHSEKKGNFYAKTYLTDPVVEVGQNRVSWDFARDYPGVKEDDVLFTVSATPLAESEKPTYLVIDLSGGSTATKYPYHYTSEAPAHVKGATDEPCQTTELWLRRIHPTDASVVYMGYQYSGGSTFYAKQTKDYYIGIFELTQKQYQLVTGGWWDSYFTNETYRASRPVEKMYMSGIMGVYRNPQTQTSQITAASFLGKLRSKTGLPITLPSLVQWQYAARGGRTDTSVSYKRYFLDGQEASLASIARHYDNAGKDQNPSRDVGLTKGTAAVGSYLPNVFGLYDMLGNVAEFICEGPNGNNSIATGLAQYRADAGDDTLGTTAENPLVDPRGAYTVTAGARWYMNTSSWVYGSGMGNHSVFNMDHVESYDYTKKKEVGCRLSMNVE